MLSLVKIKRESGLFHWAVAPAPAFEARGWGEPLGGPVMGAGHRQCSRSPSTRGVDWKPG